MPIVETLDSDISAYIPTNIISITDGQIFLETELFNAGFKPAIDVGLSVSRVGGSAQTRIMKKVASKLRLELANFRELANFSQFASELEPSTRKKLENGNKLMEMLKQPAHHPIPLYKQVVLLYAGINGYFESVPLDAISGFEKNLNQKLGTSFLYLAQDIEKEQELSPKIEKEIKTLITEVLKE